MSTRITIWLGTDERRRDCHLYWELAERTPGGAAPQRSSVTYGLSGTYINQGPHSIVSCICVMPLLSNRSIPSPSSVGSKLKCPVFVASEMSGFKVVPSPIGLGWF